MPRIARNAETFQGNSWLTERKEFEIGGLTRMRLLQLKSLAASQFYDRIIIADVFSGSGSNTIEAGADAIEGSPLRLLWALDNAVNTKRGPNPMALAGKRVDFFFSDIRPDAIASLAQKLGGWSPPVTSHISTAAMDASSAIQMLTDAMADMPRAHMILVLDPNGGCFVSPWPRMMLISLYSSSLISGMAEGRRAFLCGRAPSHETAPHNSPSHLARLAAATERSQPSKPGFECRARCADRCDLPRLRGAWWVLSGAPGVRDAEEARK